MKYLALAGIIGVNLAYGAAAEDVAKQAQQTSASDKTTINMTFGSHYNHYDLADVKTMIDDPDCEIKDHWRPEFESGILIQSSDVRRFATSTEGAANVAEELCEQRRSTQND